MQKTTIELEEVFNQKIQSIAETYHDRDCMSNLSMRNQICKCCESIVIHTTLIEHDSQERSKDLSICIDCYTRIYNYWTVNKPRKIAPI